MPSEVEASPAADARRNATVLLLAIAGGSLDAAVLLGFGVLTAAQTGNTVLLAVALARRQFATGLSAAISVLGYLTGTAVGELAIVEPGPVPRSPAVRRALLAELIPLGGLLVAWQVAGAHPGRGAVAFMVVLAALAMGMQSAAVLRLHAGPTTTYVTGTLTIFATKAVEWLHLVEAQPAAPAGQVALAGALLYGVTWLVYLAGAVIGALLYLRVGGLVLLLPAVAVLGAVVAEVRLDGRQIPPEP